MFTQQMLAESGDRRGMKRVIQKERGKDEREREKEREYKTERGER